MSDLKSSLSLYYPDNIVTEFAKLVEKDDFKLSQKCIDTLSMMPILYNHYVGYELFYKIDNQKEWERIASYSHNISYRQKGDSATYSRRLDNNQSIVLTNYDNYYSFMKLDDNIPVYIINGEFIEQITDLKLILFRKNRHNTIIAIANDLTTTSQDDFKNVNDLLKKYPMIECDDLNLQLNEKYALVMIKKRKSVKLIKSVNYDELIFSELTKDDKENIKYAYLTNDNFKLNANISFYKDILIERKDVLLLNSSNWLTNSAIDYYTAILNDIFINICIFRVESWYSIYNYKGNKGYWSDVDGFLIPQTKKTNNILSLDKLFIPMNKSENHWTLYVIDNIKREFYYYNSLYGVDNLADEIKQFNNKHGTTYTKGVCESPKQINSSDCGVFMLMNIYFLCFRDSLKKEDGSFIYGQENMEHFRNKICLTILNGELS